MTFFILIDKFRTPLLKSFSGEVLIGYKKYHLTKKVTLPIDDCLTQILSY